MEEPVLRADAEPVIAAAVRARTLPFAAHARHPLPMGAALPLVQCRVGLIPSHTSRRQSLGAIVQPCQRSSGGIKMTLQVIRKIDRAHIRTETVAHGNMGICVPDYPVSLTVIKNQLFGIIVTFGRV